MAQKSQKDLNFSVLLDHYGPALTQKQRDILTEYYDADLSLSEIAENYGITRQGVRDAIKHGEAALLDLEAKLGYAQREETIREALERMEQLVRDIRFQNTGLYEPVRSIQQDTDELLQILRRLTTREETPDGL